MLDPDSCAWFTDQDEIHSNVWVVKKIVLFSQFFSTRDSFEVRKSFFLSEGQREVNTNVSKNNTKLSEMGWQLKLKSEVS